MPYNDQMWRETVQRWGVSQKNRAGAFTLVTNGGTSATVNQKGETLAMVREKSKGLKK